MSWAAPAWLAGLLVLPVLWWLHRLAQHGRTVWVASVLLWRGEPARSRTEADAPRRLDATWLRRALAVALLFLGLAGPSLTTRVPRLVIWFDGAASLATVEDGTRRIDRLLELVARRVRARGATEVEVRSLSDPGFARTVVPPFAGLAEALPSGSPLLPAAAALDPRAEHWVVTDGASGSVNSWIARMPLAAVVSTGTATENVAVIGLAARPALGHPERLDVEIRIRNAGHAAARRQLTLSGPSAVLWSSPVTLEPGATATLRTTLAEQVLPLTAAVSPKDALAADDHLELAPSEPLLDPIFIDRRCGPALGRAIAAHPRLRPVATPDEASLRLDCGGLPSQMVGPLLSIRGTGAPRVSRGPPRWGAGAGRLTPPALGAPLRLRAPLAPATGTDDVLLADGDEALIVRRAASGRVETSLDLDDPALAADPAYPALVRVLIDASLGRHLLEALPTTRRAPESADIAPLVRWPERLPRAAPVPGSARELAQSAWAIAALLIALDGLLALRTLAGDRRFYRGEAS